MINDIKFQNFKNIQEVDNRKIYVFCPKFLSEGESNYKKKKKMSAMY